MVGSSGLAVWKEGLGKTEASLENTTKQGKEIKLILDCDAAKLSLHLTIGRQFHSDIPKNKTWRRNVNMRGQNDKIRIMNK